MVEEETLAANSVLRTKELLVEGRNEDPVTGYPFEVPETRAKLIGIIDGQIKSKGAVVFIDADIDDLKQVNDAVGKKQANQGIRKVVEEKEEALLKLKGLEALYTYRPQAGGDEFRMLLLLSQADKSLLGTIQSAVAARTALGVEGGGKLEIKSSTGVVAREFGGKEIAEETLGVLEKEAEIILTQEKAKRILNSLEETIQTGRKLEVENYIEEVVSRWGTRRMTKAALEIILRHFLAKAMTQSLKTNH